MSIASVLVISFAFGISNMVYFRQCAMATPVQLSKGLLLTLLTAAVQTAVCMLAVRIGDLLRFESEGIGPNAYAQQNAAVALALIAFVAVRQLWPYMRRKQQVAVFSLERMGSVVGLVVVLSVNVLLVGLGLGFAGDDGSNHGWAIALLLLFPFVLGYCGIMFGRQKVQMRPRRWMIVSSILLLGLAISVVVNA